MFRGIIVDVGEGREMSKWGQKYKLPVIKLMTHGHVMYTIVL